MYILYRKELSDHFSSVRFYILFCVLAVICIVSLSGAVSSLASAATATTSDASSSATSTSYMFLNLFTTSGSSTYSFATFVGFLGPLIGIMLGFDAINEEQSQGTLNRLAAQPIYRDTIINAKFLAGATAIAVCIFSLGTLIAAIGMLISGITPESEEVARYIIWLIIAWIYLCMWLAIAIFFSTVCRHAATAALACVAIWIVLTLFISLIASGIANAVYPVSKDSMESVLNSFRNYSLQTNVSRISPYYLFSEVTTMILNPNVRSTNLISIMESSEGAVAGYMSLGQSFLQVWPHIIAMIAVQAAAFAAAYITFMRREIRA
jgi:ABC-2 type transport system permease protein